ncbi:prepilin peptidase [Phenylobacterium sp. LjRoot225]|uniref:A24 family peptidase n=1 Tax=Phenylobacterium sp. LjRoot225 TaxID=3342285 RepID=UPI003ECE0EBD
MIHAVLTVVLMIFPALVILGGVRDLVSYRIPNWISLALIAGFALAAGTGLAAGMSLGAVGLNLAVGAGALAVGVAMFALGWIGGGDAKLFAAAALWIGWPSVESYLAVTALSGGALSLLLLSLRAPAARTFVLAGPAWFARLAEPGESVPYGVAIAVGALAAFPASTLVQAATAH